MFARISVDPTELKFGLVVAQNVEIRYTSVSNKGNDKLQQVEVEILRKMSPMRGASDCAQSLRVAGNW